MKDINLNSILFGYQNQLSKTKKRIQTSNLVENVEQYHCLLKDNQAPWRSDEPDNRLGDEACAKMNADSPMEMYDVLCTDGRTMYAICEL